MQENPYKSWLHHVIMFHPLVARPNRGRRSPSRNILWYLYPIQQWHCQAKFWLHDWLRHLPVDHFVDEVQHLHVRLLPEDHGSIKGRLLCHQFLSRGEFRMVGQRSLPSSDATKTEHNLSVISQGLDRLDSVSFRSSCAICPLKKNIFSAECNHQYCSRPENGWTKISSSPSLEKLNFSGRWT